MFDRLKDWITVRRYDKEEKKKERAEDEEKINLLNFAKKWYIQRWEEFTRGILSGKYNELDIQTYTGHEDNVEYSITRVKNKVEEKRKRDVYNAVLNNDKPLKTRLLEEVKRELLVNREELERTRLWNAYDDSEIVQKNKKIKRLEDATLKSQVLIEKLMQDNESASDEPKKRGRPSKEELAKRKVTAFIEGEESATKIKS